MNKEDIIRMVREAGLHRNDHTSEQRIEAAERFAALVAAAAERDAIEAELLKLKKGIGGSSMYIQGRWDLLGEFQDIIRARSQS